MQNIPGLQSNPVGMDGKTVVCDHSIIITARTDAIALACRTDPRVIAQNTFAASLAVDTSGYNDAGIMALWATAGPAFACTRRAFSVAAALRASNLALAAALWTHWCSTGRLFAHAAAKACGAFDKFVPPTLFANSAG